jgi:hypothetical protein
MVVEERRRCCRKSGRLVPVSPRINISLINFSSPGHTRVLLERLAR